LLLTEVGVKQGGLRMMSGNNAKIRSRQGHNKQKATRFDCFIWIVASIRILAQLACQTSFPSFAKERKYYSGHRWFHISGQPLTRLVEPARCRRYALGLGNERVHPRNQWAPFKAVPIWALTGCPGRLRPNVINASRLADVLEHSSAAWPFHSTLYSCMGASHLRDVGFLERW
jgi:hypothetical protein